MQRDQERDAITGPALLEEGGLLLELPLAADNLHLFAADAEGAFVAAIAAGCTAVIKPSELTGATAQVVAEIVSNAFSEDEVAVVQGGVETSTHPLNLPSNHIYFTGSPAVGKIVMKAAAQHPCSVTLELGGKSPVIVDDMKSMKDAAKKIAWAKLSNAGQICVAPDYVFVPGTASSNT